MKVIAELTIIPIGIGPSLSSYVAEIHKILEQYNFTMELHSNGTNIEGEYDEVMEAVKKCHNYLHNEKNVPRISTIIKLGTRIDKDKNMLDKAKTVLKKASKNI